MDRSSSSCIRRRDVNEPAFSMRISGRSNGNRHARVPATDTPSVNDARSRRLRLGNGSEPGHCGWHVGSWLQESCDEAFHTIVLRDGRATLVAGETGSGRSQVLKQFLDNHLVLGMGVQSAVEATRTPASDKSQALPEVGHRRQVPGTLQQEGRTVTSGLWPTTIQDRVGAIAIDRRHGLLIGGQDAERGGSIAGY